MATKLEENAVALKTWTANCHCKAFIIEFEHVPFEEAKPIPHDCNCSYCIVDAGITIIVPTDAIKFLKGSEEEFTVYRFASKENNLYFCPICGQGIMGTNPKLKMAGINLRAVKDVEGKSVDVSKISVKHYDDAEEDPQ